MMKKQALFNTLPRLGREGSQSRLLFACFSIADLLVAPTMHWPVC